jgi:hypothetical protein
MCCAAYKEQCLAPDTAGVEMPKDSDSRLDFL